MSNRVSWPAAMREQAKAEDKSLFAVACDGKRMRAQFMTRMEHDRASRLLSFNQLVITGSDPAEAFAEVWP